MRQSGRQVRTTRGEGTALFWAAPSQPPTQDNVHTDQDQAGEANLGNHLCGGGLAGCLRGGHFLELLMVDVEFGLRLGK